MTGGHMLESEQAQAVARWSHSGYEEMTRYDDGVYVLYDDHKAIVDSQAQKNEKLLAENNVLAILVDELKADREAQAVRLEKVESLYAIARTQVEEQAKELAEARNSAEYYRDEYCNELAVMPAHFKEFYGLPWEKQ